MIQNGFTIGMGILACLALCAGIVLAIRERRATETGQESIDNDAIATSVPGQHSKSTFARENGVSIPEETNRLDGWIRRVLRQSGLNWTASQTVSSGVMAGIVFAVAVFHLTQNAIAASMTCAIASVSPLAYVAWTRKVRLARAEQQLPGALELLAGAMRSGLSLEQGLRSVGETLEDPMAGDLKLLAGQLELGRSIHGATKAINDRTPLPDMQLFTVTLNTHRAAGGNLVHSLSLLAAVARDRLQFRQSVRSKMAAGKLSAVGTAIGGPFTVLYFVFFAPEYASLLLEHSTGQIVLCISAVLWIVGLMWVWKLSKA